jgi:lysozyme
MKFSQNGLKLLASNSYEGDILRIYKDAAGKPTIGVGHLLTSAENANGKIDIAGKQVLIGSGITEQQSLDLLAQDVKPAEDAVNYHVKVALNQNQFDALVIFTFNVGTGGFESSSLLTAINEKDIADIPEDFMKWDKITKNGVHVVCDGLVTRRKLEIKLYDS